MGEVKIPKKLEGRFEAIIERAWALPDNNWETFWDDIINAMENRLTVLEETSAKEVESQDLKVLLIDDREPISFAEIVAKNCPIPIDIKRLKTGDYLCEDVIVERKEAADFAASIKDKRLFNQLERLKEFKHPFILISGNFNDLQSKINRHSLMGAIAYLASQNISIIKIDSHEDLAYLILKIFEKFGKLKMQNGAFKV